MELSKALTPEEHLELSKHLEAARDVVSKAVGCKCDLIAVAHKVHTDQETCEGAAVLSDLGALQTFMLLGQAHMSMEAKARDEYVLRHVSANELPA